MIRRGTETLAACAVLLAVIAGGVIALHHLNPAPEAALEFASQ